MLTKLLQIRGSISGNHMGESSIWEKNVMVIENCMRLSRVLFELLYVSAKTEHSNHFITLIIMTYLPSLSASCQ